MTNSSFKYHLEEANSNLDKAERCDQKSKKYQDKVARRKNWATKHHARFWAAHWASETSNHLSWAKYHTEQTRYAV